MNTALPITKGEQAHDAAMAALKNWPAALKMQRESDARMAEEARNHWALEQQANSPDPFFPGGAA